MSTRQKGNVSENAVAAMAEALGYATFAARGSRGPADIIAFPTTLESHQAAIIFQVGTSAKPIARTLAELEAAPRPIGSLCIVARKCKRGNGRVFWRFHSRAGTFEDLKDCISGGSA